MAHTHKQEGFRPADDSGILVPSRSLTISALTEQGRPMSFDELAEVFEMRSKQERTAYFDRLQRMSERGMLLRDRRKRYSLPNKMDLVVGKVLGHAKGFGFVIPDDGGDDLYLHPNQMRRVLHNDKVLAVVSRIDSRGRKEGKIVEAIVDREREILGHYGREAGVHFVDPDDARYGREIVISAEGVNGAVPGEVVAVKIIKHPIEHRHVVGEIVDILGKQFEPGMETDIAIRKYELPYAWPQAVDQQLEQMRDELAAVNYDRDDDDSRKDLRKLPLVTIDGSDARDFDDAVYAEKTRTGWRLLVAIADVSHYVRPGSELDKEAYNRGTSVYFPNRVIPMLPEELSNGICSLNPAEDRNCMVCDMRFDAEGELDSYQFYAGVMYSHGRLTYEEMANITVEKLPEARQARGDLCTHLDDLYAFYQLLVTQRKKRRTIDFEFPEPLFIFNDQQKIDRVEKRSRNDAHRIIEECMLAANVCAAKFIESKSKKGGIYRVHEGPDDEALTDLRAFLSGFGLQLGGGDSPGAEHYAEVLEALESQPDLGPLIQIVLLRSLKQAIYSSESLGHFALNYDHYTHFTSPIRRYPDLVVHRLIKQLVRARGSKYIGPKGETLGSIGEHASFTERRADEATRDVARWLKAEFMQEYVGEEFDGQISGVKEFGIFVELSDFFVDGLVHVTMLGNDYFHYDPKHFLITGERTGVKFRLGGKVRVKVLSSDIDTGKIDFALVSEPGADSGGTPTSQKQPKKAKQAGKNRGKKPAAKKSAGQGAKSGGRKPAAKKSAGQGAKSGGKKPAAKKSGGQGAKPRGRKPAAKKSAGQGAKSGGGNPPRLRGKL